MSQMTPFESDGKIVPVSQQPDIFKPPLDGFDWDGYKEREGHLASIAGDPEQTRAALAEYRKDPSGVGVMLDNLHNRTIAGPPVGNLPASLAVMSRSVVTMGLPGLNFRGGVATQASYAGIDLRGADFTDSVAPLADFSGADLQGVSFVNAILNVAKFDGADLDGVDFSGAYMVNVEGLTQEQLQNVIMRGARVIVLPTEVEQKEGMLGNLSSHFGGLIGQDEVTKYVDPVPVAVRGTSVPMLQANKDYKGLYADGLVLNNVDFTRSRLQGVTLAQVVARGIVLRNAQMSGVVVMGSEDVNTDMREADMHSMWAPGSYWAHVDLNGANLAKANLAGSVFRGVDLSNVTGLDENGTNLEGVVFEECRLPAGFTYDGLGLVLPKPLPEQPGLPEGDTPTGA